MANFSAFNQTTKFERKSLVKHIDTMVSRLSESEEESEDEMCTFEDLMSEINHKIMNYHFMKVSDVFGLALRKSQFHFRGYAVLKTSMGFFKSVWLSLCNSELYIYADEQQKSHTSFIVLKPNAFFQLKDSIDISVNKYDF